MPDEAWMLRRASPFSYRFEPLCAESQGILIGLRTWIKTFSRLSPERNTLSVCSYIQSKTAGDKAGE